MDDYYCFRKIKNTALVMVAVVAVHVALSLPLGYYWNALQASLSGIELSLSGAPAAGNASQGLIIYLLLFGIIALLAFLTSPKRTSIWWRLILIAPLSIFVFSAYVEYGKISPVSEKFKDLYDSLEYAVFIPHAVIAAVTAVYLLFVIVLPMFGITQALGWVAAVAAIISYLGSALFIVYSHTMTILEGSFGASEFYTYLAVFALDVVSYFIMLSVLMTYCTIKREERWDRLEARSIEEEKEQDFEVPGNDSGRRSLFSKNRPQADDLVSYDEPLGDADYDLRRRFVPDIEDLKEHEFHTSEYEAYGYAAEPVAEDEPIAVRKSSAEKSDVGKSDTGENPAVKNKSASKKKFKSKRKSSGKRKSTVDDKVVKEDPIAIEESLLDREGVANEEPAIKEERVADEKPAMKEERVADEKPAMKEESVAVEKPKIKKSPIVRDEHRKKEGFFAKDKPVEEDESAMTYESVAAEYEQTVEDEPVVANRANRNARGNARKESDNGSAKSGSRSRRRPRGR